MLGIILSSNADSLGLFKFLEDNWFTIGLIITLIGSVVKLSTKVQKQIDLSETRIKNIEEDIDDIKAKSNKDGDTLHKELMDQNKLFHEELVDLTNKMNEEFSIRYDKIDSRLEEIEQKRLDSSERNRIMLDGIEATLISLHDDGHNGPVTKSLQDIRDYKSRKASND